MSWNGTVRCGHCWESGHNRSSCPDLRKKIEELAKENPDDFRVRHYYQKKAHKAAKLKNKSCSYCEYPGHTRRTCLELKHAKKVAVKECREFRRKVVDGLKQQGIGIGALVEYNTWNETKLAIVTSIQWDKLDHRILYDGVRPSVIRISPVADLLEESSYGSALTLHPALWDSERSYVDSANGIQYGNYINPADAQTIENQVPAAFLQGLDCVESIFMDKEKSTDRPTHWVARDWCKIQGFYTGEGEVFG
jgi:hypothetical protein